MSVLSLLDSDPRSPPFIYFPLFFSISPFVSTLLFFTLLTFHPVSSSFPYPGPLLPLLPSIPLIFMSSHFFSFSFALPLFSLYYSPLSLLAPSLHSSFSLFSLLHSLPSPSLSPRISLPPSFHPPFTVSLPLSLSLFLPLLLLAPSHPTERSFI